MGIYSASGQDGVLRQYKISGDAPTPTELARIQALHGGGPAPVAKQEEDAPGWLGAAGRRYGAGVLGAGGGLARSYFDAPETAKWLEGGAQDLITEANRRTPTHSGNWDDVNGAGDFLSYLYENAGSSVPYTAAALTAGGLAAAASGGNPFAALAGATAVNIPAFTGDMLERQQQEMGVGPEGTNFTTALAAGTGSALLEATINRLFGIGPGTTIGKKLLEKGIAKTLPRQIALGAAEGTLQEGLTETAQQALEIVQANPDKFWEFGEGVQKEITNAAIAGGLLGGILGGAGATLPNNNEREAKSREKALEQRDEDYNKEAKDGLALNGERIAKESAAASAGNGALLLPAPEGGTTEYPRLGYAPGAPPINPIDALPPEEQAKVKAGIASADLVGPYTVVPVIEDGMVKGYKAASADTEEDGVFDTPEEAAWIAYDANLNEEAYGFEGLWKKEPIPIRSLPEVYQGKFDPLKKSVTYEKAKNILGAEAVDDIILQIAKKNTRSPPTKPTPVPEPKPKTRADGLPPYLGKEPVYETVRLDASGTPLSSDRPAGAPVKLADWEKRGKPGWAVIKKEVSPDGFTTSQELVSTHVDPSQAKAAIDALKPRPMQATSPDATQTTDQVYPDQFEPQPGIPIKQTLIRKPDVTPKVAPAVARERNEVLESLKGMLRDMGLGRMKIGLADYLADDKGVVDAGIEGFHARTSSGAPFIKLATAIWEKGISQAELTKRLASVLNHEVIHALKEMGAFSDTELAALTKYVRTKKIPGKLYTFMDMAEKRYSDLSQEDIAEEAMAEAFRAWAENKNGTPTHIAGLFGRMVALLRKLAEFLNQNNSKIEKVFKKVASGEAARNAPADAVANYFDPLNPDKSLTKHSLKGMIGKITGNYTTPKKETLASGMEVINYGFVNLGRVNPAERARDIITRRAANTGVENLIDVDTIGNVSSNLSGTRYSCGLTSESFRKMRDPSQKLVIHHTHPDTSSLSPADLGFLGYKGMHAIYAHSDNGTGQAFSYRAEITPAGRAYLDAVKGTDRYYYDHIKTVADNLYKAISTAAKNVMLNDIKDFHLQPPEWRENFGVEIINMVPSMFSDAGFIKYHHNYVSTIGVEKYASIKSIYDEAVRSIRQVIKPFGQSSVYSGSTPDIIHPGDVGEIHGRGQRNEDRGRRGEIQDHAKRSGGSGVQQAAVSSGVKFSKKGKSLDAWAKDRFKGMSTPDINGKPVWENFVKWFKGSAVLDDAGNPRVVYHGTTNDFTEFDGSKANPDSESGAGFYFTSNPSDASQNYTKYGRDLIARVDNWIAESHPELMGSEEEGGIFEVLRGLINEKTLGTGYDPQYEALYEEALDSIGRNENDGTLMPVFLAIKKPLVVGGKAHTKLDIEEMEHLGQAFDDAISDYEIDSEDASFFHGRVEDLLKEGKGQIYARRLSDTFRRLPVWKFTDMGEQQSAGGDLLKNVLSRLGYDGIIDNSVSSRFGHDAGGVGMDHVTKDTTHFIAFHPNQIKSASGNYGFFSPKSNDIRFSKKGAYAKSKIVDENGDPIVVYHGTSSDTDFNSFKRKERGTWFAGSPVVASDYAEENEARGLKWDGAGKIKEVNTASRVIPVYLNFENPKVYTPDDFYKEVARIGGDGVNGYKRGEAELARRAKSEKHDGIVIGVIGSDKAAYIAFEPNQIKSAIGNKGTFDRNSKDIRFSRKGLAPADYSKKALLGGRIFPTTRRGVRAAQGAAVYGRVADWMGRQAGMVGVSQEAVDTFVVKLQDKALPLGRLVDKVRAEGGRVEDALDVKLREELFAGRTGERIKVAEDQVYSPLMNRIKAIGFTTLQKEALARLTPNLSRVTNEKSINKGLMNAFLYARHAPERNAAVLARNPGMQNGSGISDQEANAALAWFARQPQYNRVLEAERAFRGIIADTNKNYVEYGLNPADLNSGFQFYAPLQGFLEEDIENDEEMADRMSTGQGFKIKGKENKAFGGRQRIAGSIIAHTIMQNEVSVIRGEKNRVGLALVDLIDANPALLNDTVEVVNRAPYKRVVTNGMVKLVPDPLYKSRDEYFVVKRDGQEIAVHIKKANLAKALTGSTGIGDETAGNLVRAMSKVTRTMAALNTAWNPEFTISNLLRDIQTAGISIQQFEEAGLSAKVLKNLIPAMKAVHAMSANTLGTRKTAAEVGEFGVMYDQMRGLGGKTEFWGLMSVEDRIRDINKDLASPDELSRLEKTKRGISKLFDFVEAYNDTVETGTRLAVYKAMVDSGFSGERAAQAAKNVVVNFNKGGEWKTAMNAFYMFYNAAIQGTFSLIHAMATSPRVRKIVAGIVVAGFVQDMIMSMISGEDDNGNTIYDSIPDYILQTRMVFMDPFGITDRGYFAIPMPYGYNAFHNMGRTLSRGLMRGRYTPGEVISNGLGTFADAYNPVGGTSSLLNFFSPTILDPVVELAENSDFAGRPIYKDGGQGASPLPSSQMYFNSATTPARFVTDTLNTLTGGSPVRPGMADVSPDVLDYLFDYFAGGAGAFIKRTGEFGAVTVPAAISGDLEEFEVRQVPFVRKFFGNVTTSNDMEQYIRVRDQVGYARKELEYAVKEGDYDAARATKDNYKKELSVAGIFKAVETQRNSLMKKIKKIEASKLMTDEAKKEMTKKLRDQINEVVGRAIKAYNMKVRDAS